MNYYIVPIQKVIPSPDWTPDVITTNYEARCYNIPTDCKIKTEDVCDNGTPITQEDYEGDC